ncbi:hypothetical protein M419DRAFT_124365 [Trichoderma reesei RUT C-30]|uniref:Uncharacterized protein n=1 Tax=Hypocrea jecorina (strain ATCC 56765 / BCRC 32924 / NRRL 11460 / Rut C-30) TaxID=1344414 RepID=A0A024S352_HYPJR|nr:hypothetical protein M419DRAFT_124365 [Trichoderma reesei RUT C-30]
MDTPSGLPPSLHGEKGTVALLSLCRSSTVDLRPPLRVNEGSRANGVIQLPTEALRPGSVSETVERSVPKASRS